jgi:hypothetical protein
MMEIRAQDRSSPAGRGLRESIWVFLDRSSRTESKRTKALVRQWLAEYPCSHVREMRRRLQSSSDNQFLAAFFELYLHRLLILLGLAVRIPTSPGPAQKTEDFAILRGETEILRLEARFVGREEAHAKQDRFCAQLRRALNQIDCPSFGFGFALSGEFQFPPRYGRVAKAFGRWLHNNTPSMLQLIHEGARLSELPRFVRREAGARIEGEAIVLKYAQTASPKPIALWSPGARDMATHQKLRRALKAKASRYGRPRRPYVIAVAVEECCDDLEVTAALFGDEVFGIPFDEAGTGGQPCGHRKQNGFWIGPHGVQNRRVSAILAVSELFPMVGRARPTIYHNPWADHPLPTALLPIEQVAFDRTSCTMQRKPGIPVGQIMGLEETWPLQ